MTMASLSRLAIRHPRPVLAMAAIVTGVAALGLPRLRLETDGRALVPQRDPQVMVDREIRGSFSVRDFTVVVLTTGHPSGVFNFATLHSVQEITRALGQLAGVRPANLLSLATVPGLRSPPGTPIPAGLLEGALDAPGGPAAAAQDFARIHQWQGLLVSRDGRSTALYVGTPPTGDRHTFYRKVRRIVEAGRAPGDTSEVLGAPVSETLLGHHILTDLGMPPPWLEKPAEREREAVPVSLRERLRAWVASTLGLAPFAVVIISLVFFLVFRRPAAALVPMIKVGACVTITFGAMGWLGVPIYLTTAVLPVLLTAVGITDEIHILRHARELAREESGGDGTHAILQQCLDELTMPLVQTEITTAIGFASFAVSSIGPAQAFGIWGAIGVLVCLLWSLTITPALLVTLQRRRWASTTTPSTWPERAFVALGRGAYRRRRRLLLVTMALAAVAGLAALELEVQDSWLDGFDPRSGFAQATHRFESQFCGADLLLLELSADSLHVEGEIHPSALQDRRVVVPTASITVPVGNLAGAWLWLTQVQGERREWQGWISAAHRTGGHLALEVPAQNSSPRHWLKTEGGPGPVRYEIYREPFMAPKLLHRAEELEAFASRFAVVGGAIGPATQLKTVSFLLAPERERPRSLPDDPSEILTLWSSLRVASGPDRLRQVVEPESYTRTLITLFLKGANYKSFVRLKAALADFALQRLKPDGITLRFAGNAAISQAMIAAVVKTQVASLALSRLR